MHLTWPKMHTTYILSWYLVVHLMFVDPAQWIFPHKKGCYDLVLLLRSQDLLEMHTWKGQSSIESLCLTSSDCLSHFSSQSWVQSHRYQYTASSLKTTSSFSHQMVFGSIWAIKVLSTLSRTTLARCDPYVPILFLERYWIQKCVFTRAFPRSTNVSSFRKH